jgi:DNA (cytosine-5-)-methyltransferase
MTHASLFSGIGGFDLAAEWAGFTNVFHCENDLFCQKVLNHHFPNSISYENIKTTDFTKHRDQITVLSGGFPCQPFSVSGKRKGANDDRYLWPEMRRAIREIRPTWVIGENVNGITSMVLPPQEAGVESETADGETDRVSEFVVERICQELEEEGYTVQPLVIPACGVGAPHKRDRVWFLAHRTDTRSEEVQQAGTDRVLPAEPATDTLRNGRKERWSNSGRQAENTPVGAGIFGEFERLVQEWTASHSVGDRCLLGADNRQGGQLLDDGFGIAPQNKPQRCGRECWSCEAGCIDGGFADTQDNGLPPCAQGAGQVQPWGADERTELSGYWNDFPTQSPVCSGDDGLSSGLDAITFPRWRRESIKAYGNAIVPQVAYRILSMIAKIETL